VTGVIMEEEIDQVPDASFVLCVAILIVSEPPG
jgi:hypothetical protein